MSTKIQRYNNDIGDKKSKGLVICSPSFGIACFVPASG